MIRTLRKRDGTPVWVDPDKLNKWAEWSAGLGVDWSSIVLGASRKCFDGCSTDDLHDALISECIDQETTAHLKMAGRLYIGRVYKQAFGSWQNLPTVREMYSKMTANGMWVVMDYTQEELDYCQSFINHGLDMQATLTETKQVIDKYAIVDRVDKKVYETPQFVYMRMALGNMEKMPKDRRMADVKKLYTYLSLKKINPPSPFSLNLGTPKKQYASCCTFTTKDEIPSLAAADHIAYMMTCASAGIGSHLKTRSKGDKVRGGTIKHLGKIPYYKVQQALVAANLQASRGGANTMHFNVLDPEFFDLVRLKAVQTVADKRVKDIDYSVGYNSEFARRVAKNETWMLVSYGDAPELYEALYSSDIEKFRKLYVEVEANVLIPKTIVKARDMAIEFLTQSVETGRFYEHNTEEMNRHTPFLEKIYSSNLCQEIALATSGFSSVAALYSEEAAKARDGEIGLCSLAAIAAGLVTPEEYEDVAYYACLMIDNVIDIMEYPFPHLKVTAQARRSIGVGITNLAFDMAQKKLKYSSLEGKKYIARLAEMHSFYLHKAALRLAKERGVCEWKTKYNKGWLPIDTANLEVLYSIDQSLEQNWGQLRKEIAEVGGLRFSVLEAHMPCESSSVAGGHTNGLYPIRAYKVVKTSGSNKVLFIAPELDTLKEFYELAWDIPTKDLIEMYAIVQCFTGQAISADLYIKYASEERKISTTVLLQEWLLRVKLGLKTRYYINSATGVDLPSTREEEAPACDSCSL